MAQELRQEFNPEIKIKNGENEYSIRAKIWEWDDEYGYFLKSIETNKGVIPTRIYMASAQIEEVWKYYMTENGYNCYISNLGYVAWMTTEESKKVFGDSEGKEKGIPLTRLDGCKNDITTPRGLLVSKVNNKYLVASDKDCNNEIEVDLYLGKIVEEKIVATRETIYSIVAELFLGKKPEGCVVHHIDNNSYNNSVTNLVYVPSNKHTGKKLHPMSR